MITTQLDLYKTARDLAETLVGETSARKISVAINDKFASLELDDADYQPFQNHVMSVKNQYEVFSNQPTITEQKRKQAEANKPKTP